MRNLHKHMETQAEQYEEEILAKVLPYLTLQSRSKVIFNKHFSEKLMEGDERQSSTGS